MKRLAELRKAKGLTQADLAEKLMTSQAAISKWERGGSKPYRSTLKRICEALGCQLEDLVPRVPRRREGGRASA